MSDWSSDVCSSDLFSGIPTNRCSAAQLRQAVRQPNSTSSQAERGQPTVLAKPANKVIPVMALRAWLPYSFTTVEKAASYKPMPMPAPISSQAMKNTEEPGDHARQASQAAKTKWLTSRTGRPPYRTLHRPAKGQSRGGSHRARETKTTKERKERLTT